MSLEGDTADKLVHEGIEITEHAIKLAGLGAKNLAALLLALLKDNQKLKGKTNMNRLLRSDKPLSTFTIKRGDLAEFAKRAKHEGVLFAAARNIHSKKDLVDVFVWDERAAWMNRMMEDMGYAAPLKDVSGKNVPARAQHEGKSNGRGYGLLQQAMERMNNPMKKMEGKGGALENLPAEVLAAAVLKVAAENREFREAGPLAQLFTAEKGLQQSEISAGMVSTLQKQADTLGIPVYFAEGSIPDKVVMVARTEDAAVINRLCENMGEKSPMQLQPEVAAPAQEQKRGPGRPPKVQEETTRTGSKPSVRESITEKKAPSQQSPAQREKAPKSKTPKPKAPVR